MSWVAHDVEPYVIQKHLGRRIAFVPLLLGSYAPDLATKWFVYGVGVFGVSFKADDPAQFHRGYPGVGFTHSLLSASPSRSSSTRSGAAGSGP